MERRTARISAIPILILSWTLMAGANLLAQAGSATLTGSIVDAQGGALPGATVTATEQATTAARTITSDRDGVFRIPALAPGRYNLDITMEGFSPLKVTDVSLAPAEVKSLDKIELAIGQISESVVVAADRRRPDGDQFAYGHCDGRTAHQHSDEGSRRVGHAGRHSRRAGHQHEPELHDLDVDGGNHDQRLAQHVEGRHHRRRERHRRAWYPGSGESQHRCGRRGAGHLERLHGGEWPEQRRLDHHDDQVRHQPVKGI